MKGLMILTPLKNALFWVLFQVKHKGEEIEKQEEEGWGKQTDKAAVLEEEHIACFHFS